MIFKHTMHKYLACLAVLFCSASVSAAAGTDPTSVNVTLYKTELHNGSSWITVFESSAGTGIDLVTGSGSILGSNALPEGIYDQMRLTVGNTVSFSGTNTACTGATVATNQTIITSSSPVESVTFATAATGGQTKLYADGSDSHPYLLNAPVEVIRGKTIEIDLTFNTAGTVVCDEITGDVSLASPDLNIASRLKAASYTFTGGDYWVASRRTHAPGLYGINTLTYIEPIIDPATGISNYETLFNDPTDGEEYRAQWRRNMRFDTSWGMKARFTAPDAEGKGSVYALRNGGTHSHQMDESWCQTAANNWCASQQLGVTPADTSDMTTPMWVANYSLGADHRLSIVDFEGNQIAGAFSTDYSVLTVSNLSSGEQASIQIGVKVSTTAPTISGTSGVLSSISYGLDFDRLTLAEATTQLQSYGVASYVRNNLSNGWMRFDSISSISERTEYDSFARWDNPTQTTLNGFTSSTGQYGYYRLDNPFVIPAINADGTMISAGNWDVITPGLSFSMGVRGTEDTDANWSTATTERHGMGISIGLLQSAPGSLTVASLAGRYLISGMWDETTGGTARNGTSVGVVTIGSDGSFSLQGNDRDTYGHISAMNGTGTASVQARCFGLNLAAREANTRLNDGTSIDPVADRLILENTANRLDPALGITDCATAGGQSIDSVIITDPVRGDIAYGHVSSDGKLFYYYNASAFSDASSRSFGLAIKLSN